MPKAFIDSREYYMQRKASIEVRMMLRAYYSGFPYSKDPDNPQMDYGHLRKSILHGGTVAIDDEGNLRRAASELPDRADGIDYMENSVKTRIANTVAAILPDGTRLHVVHPDKEKIEPEVIEELFRRLLNFSDKFTTDEPEQDFFIWAKYMLTDIAQTGDGAILPRYMPPAGDKPGHIRYDFYTNESWDEEADPIFGDALFRRIFFKYVGSDGKEYFYRRDYFKDQKIEYQDQEVPVGWNKGIAPPAQTATALDPMAGVVPPELEVKNITSEAGVLDKLGECCLVTVLWGMNSAEAVRGVPEVWMDDIPAVDGDNELLNQLIEATIYSGNPPLAIVDGEMPTDKRGSEPATMSRADLAAGGIIKLQSNGPDNQQAKMTFPENIPQKFPHAESRREVQAAAMGGVPAIQPTIEGMRDLAKLSGFALMIVTGAFNEKVKDHRKLTVGRILKALRLGIKMLSIKGELPEGIPADVKLQLSYGAQMMTEDELQKQAVRFLAYSKLGVSPEVLVSELPIPPELRQQVIEDMGKRAKLEEESLVNDANQLNATESGDGIDNKVK